MKRRSLSRKEIKSIDEEYYKILGNLLERQCEVRAAAKKQWAVFDYLFAKKQCNGLVYQVTYMFEGDMEKVRDFIAKGVNIDLRAAAELFQDRRKP